ncbi:MAG: phenylalanine--tRNA ligase subunit beta [Candidatus Nealsonbacteria bacterium CG_4_10_14_0_2_um_filter_38_17]|uniref:Phenylalanine--tRNA ligase beta subunit n=1 Tax=Candidatus Nealsonbacteria bacterium CG_4_10_14_0_2_um_filter_38_17 TaxID=1974680 RepID=A0A2M7UXR4_9BACT|nr:MAG: phenylalanine--tRNA ligase subunit beta [Candidatus Nealsonbacteria bacterium CG_4_10_14_0_2_um_filter_38_17]
MKFSYNWIKNYLKGKTPSPEKMAELLTMHSFEVEKVEKIGNDWMLDIAVLPSRGPDCFSHLGIARECAAVSDSKFQVPDVRLREDKKIKAKDFVNVLVTDKNACSRYSARVITGIKVGPSPEWIQERLILCGLRPINNIVDITNYVMLETGQPLHAFDADKIDGKKIIVRFAREGEKLVTLDNQEFDLDSSILVIADSQKPIALAGIKGGRSPEIDESTKDIIIESANFNSAVIRKTSQKIGLKTDASLRFEHGLDQNLTVQSLDRVTALIQETAGGKISQGVIDFYPQKRVPRKISLDLDYVNKLLGIEIPEKEVKNILEKLGFKNVWLRQRFLRQRRTNLIKNRRSLLVEIPARRLDINLPEDLIEEIGRIYGYEKIPVVPPVMPIVPPERNDNLFWQSITKSILKEAGFTEAYNYSFIGDKEMKIFNYQKEGLIELENPLSQEQKYLCPSLIPNLLKNVFENQKYFKEIQIFELGKIFLRKQESKDKEQTTEKLMLTGLLTGDKFYDLKGIVDLLLNGLGISNIWYDEYRPSPEESNLVIWHQNKCAEIKVDNQEIGFLGEISPAIIEELKIKERVMVFDLDFDKLESIASEEHEYRPISKFPAAVRDLAVLVPVEIRVEEVLNKIETAGGALVRDVDLFDIYEGENLPEGKKNLAFHIIYQAKDHTLSSKELDEVQGKIIKALEEDLEWEVRK